MTDRNILNPVSAAKGVWERGTFTVPEDTPHSRIEEVKHKYLRKFGEALERQGFEVLEVLGPMPSQGRMPAEPGRKRYDAFARVRRKPVTLTLEVDETVMPKLEAVGMQQK